MKLKYLTWLVIILVVAPTVIYSLPFLIVGSLFFTLGFIKSPIEMILLMFTSLPESIWSPGNLLSLVPTAVPLGTFGLFSLIYLSIYYVSKKSYHINIKYIILGLLAGSVGIFQIIMYSWSAIGVKSLYLGWPLIAVAYFLVLLCSDRKYDEQQQGAQHGLGKKRRAR